MYISSLSSGGYSSCTAHITTNRNRFKIYGDSIYLKDKQKFEIELFNPNSINHLAKIKINGRWVSESGILLKPGQRIYLERFIDSNNKFVFETYTVEKSKEALEATSDNGLIEISFYPEQNPNQNYCYTYTNYQPFTITPSIGSTTTSNFNVASSLTFNSAAGANQSQGISFAGTTVNNLSSLTVCNTSNCDNNYIETGRIEKGEQSSQNFSMTYGSYSSFPTNTVSYNLLSESHKPVEVEKIRNYCTGCGNRMRKETWKFCPNCGEKF
jgi:hypothetical protein